jgi:hypothetical protein
VTLLIYQSLTHIYEVGQICFLGYTYCVIKYLISILNCVYHNLYLYFFVFRINIFLISN